MLLLKHILGGLELNSINWDKIYDKGNGYWGVAFNFRKLEHLKVIDKKGTTETYWPKYTYSQYSWHLSYDVESLIIFDTRAFDDTVELTTIKL